MSFSFVGIVILLYRRLESVNVSLDNKVIEACSDSIELIVKVVIINLNVKRCLESLKDSSYVVKGYCVLGDIENVLVIVYEVEILIVVTRIDHFIGKIGSVESLNVGKLLRLTYLLEICAVNSVDSSLDFIYVLVKRNTRNNVELCNACSELNES